MNPTASRSVRALVIPLLCSVVILSVTASVVGSIPHASITLTVSRAIPQDILDEVPATTTKPKPKWRPKWPCKPQGDGGDPALNRLKNRVDAGTYLNVTFDAVRDLAVPVGIGKKKRATWTKAQKNSVSRYEGTPIAVEGYLALAKNSNGKIEGARPEGEEACNCHLKEAKYKDYHMWLLEDPDDKRDVSIVIETTPPVRAKHTQWTVKRFTEIAKAQQRIRVSGWLMLDQEHPEQLTKTRATLWEIHPIIQIEVQTPAGWVTLK